MEVDILEEKGKKMKFLLKDSKPQFANALRRTMIGKVPTMAVEEVDFINNTSGLFDEIIAHRIGMIPWSFPEDEYRTREKCECESEEGCPNCTVEMVLKKEREAFVKAKHIKPTDKKVEPENPGILIIKLLDGQELELEAKGVLGTGKEHAKFQAASASYKFLPEIKINGEEVDNIEEVASVAPEKVKDAEGVIEADEDIVYAMNKTVDIEEGDEIEYTEDDNSFIFTVESVSGLEPRYIVKEAVRIIKEEAEELENAL